MIETITVTTLSPKMKEGQHSFAYVNIAVLNLYITTKGNKQVQHSEKQKRDTLQKFTAILKPTNLLRSLRSLQLPPEDARVVTMKGLFIGIAATKCNFRLCRKIKRAGDVGEWMRDPVTHTSYCSPTHFAQEKSINDINAGLGNPSSNDPLQTKKTAAITEIEGALNQTPPVTNNELENTNRGWRNEIQNSTSAPNITTIKDRVLQDISRKRQAKNPLPGLKSTAINQILAELAKNPPVDESEITNRN
ncbi:1674_t:CDS:2 [Paraglomus occultum]|uniref:1674_t:CDS:1 n=1 Tax=Paraglomus occultum TaxID=144539 RepID=A0A9N9CLR0_9GLOM|nr:1674_t:CDS:2 [Paraglomus occultum]